MNTIGFDAQLILQQIKAAQFPYKRRVAPPTQTPCYLHNQATIMHGNIIDMRDFAPT